MPRKTTIKFSQPALDTIGKIKKACERSSERFVSITELLEWLLRNASEKQMAEAFKNSKRGAARPGKTKG